MTLMKVGFLIEKGSLEVSLMLSSAMDTMPIGGRRRGSNYCIDVGAIEAVLL